MKSPREIQKLYRIGEVMEHSRLSRQTIHNYTVWGLITEARRTRGNHRLYAESVFPRLERILELKQSCSIAEIRERLAAEDAESGADAGAEPSGGALRA